MKSENGQKLKIPKKPRSVNSAMWTYFCLLAFILVFLLESVFYVITVSSEDGRARARLKIICEEVIAELTVNSQAEDAFFIRYRNEGVDVYLITAEGETLIPADPAMKINSADFVEFKNRIASDNVGSYVIYNFGGRLNIAQKAVYNGVDCYVFASYSTSIMKATMRSMQIYFLIVGAVVLVIALLISYTFSQKLTNGLKNISDTAVKLAEGDYTVKFANADYNEMAQLSDTLNYVRDEVKKSGDFQREILANVTHDLKTPLTMIKAYASMVKEISGDDREKREKHLQVIIDETDRLTGLVNDVLSVSKLNSKVDEISPKVFNLTELLYGIINKFGYLQETQGYSFMVDIDKDLYTRADEEKISQVIYNLLGNAANYTGEDKTVYISLKRSVTDNRIKFSVRDTGKGISKDKLPEIWDRYYRVKENHNRPVKGTGLGLNIVKVILENHSFDFGVESETGKGSTFWIDFPEIPAEIDIKA